MRRRLVMIVAASLAFFVAIATMGFSPQSSAAAAPQHPNFKFAVIGDTPYGGTQLAAFSNISSELNSRGQIRFTVHVGDIKSGGGSCDDAYFAQIKSEFDAFKRPLIFTPGDNEWTDCHRTTAGQYDPLERLDHLRSVFFADPTKSLGIRARNMRTQASQGAAEIENQLWFKPGIVFATVHITGSKNGLEPWFADDTTGTVFDDPAARIAEVNQRRASAISWLEYTFDVAANKDAHGIVIFEHADMFNLAGDPRFEHEEFVERLAELARDFNRPVLLVNGDTHSYNKNQPFLDTPVRAPKLRRITVEGNGTEFLRIRVDFSKNKLFLPKRISF